MPKKREPVSLNRQSLVVEVAKRTGYQSADVKYTVDTVLDVIKENLQAHGDCEFRGFGSFRLKKRKGRKMKNLNGTMVVVPDRMKVEFRQGWPVEEVRGS